MRIIGGEARGRRIQLPKGCRVRPTADRVKESLFNILNPIEGVCFLDAFAGSGNVGMEALSRGARYSVFLEKDFRLVEVLQMNLNQLGFAGRAEIIASDAKSALRRLKKKGDKFDILFADPPYQEGFISEILFYLDGAELLTENGTVVLQHSVREALEGLSPRQLVVSDRRRYGDTMLTFLRRSPEE